ncbi:hypothetical protein E3T39_06660 [Cryobacterium suzukii]|uniref:Uncharacterized protein n=1 Tax=Cryobacterium suzukii TaxID=1259198 RepID=A0A4R9AHE6_9MICO|nr:hypothetical protein [Cryobacterium suzukii]TFD61706.1 hypothetical protein E3T39_06660 [Cryobacterium suzukii]
MTALRTATSMRWRGATIALLVGLVLSVVLLGGVVIDQTIVHSLLHHVEALYAPYELQADPNVLFVYLYATGLIGIGFWLLVIWGARAGRPWTPIVTTLVFLIGAGLAVFSLVVAEYDTQIFPQLWGVLGLLPSVAGLVAVLLLWSPGPKRN